MLFLTSHSDGSLSSPGYAGHRCRTNSYRYVFHFDRLGRSEMAYRLYRSESILLGFTSQLHPTCATHYAKFYMERCPMYALHHFLRFLIIDNRAGWNGGRLCAVCITAIWPSFARIKNRFGPDMPTTTYEFVGFVVFWFLSTPFLWLRPEKFKVPFLIVCAWCSIGMFAWMIWALAEAKGVGPLWNTSQQLPANSPWNSSWLIMAGINQSLGSLAAGITNGSDFSRYASARRHYIIGTITSCLITGILVSLVGLVTAAAAQKIYGEVYWNPPDLLMVMMDNGNGSSKARAAVFFLSAGFAFTAMFENICGNAIAGGIDLAGLFPRYIDIRRGAIITFLAAWIVQPWQLINRATTFIAVLSSFSVFLAPMIGIMACDYYLLRKRKVRLSHLYRTVDSSYYFWKGINWRAIPAWICGWAPTIGGLVVTVRMDPSPPRPLVHLYYMAFLIGENLCLLVELC